MAAAGEWPQRPEPWWGTSFAVTRSSAALLFLNLADALLTLLFLQLGWAEEANPLLRLAYQGSPTCFMSVKLAVVHLAVLTLCLSRTARWARPAVRLGALVYGSVVAYELSWALRLGLS